MYENALKFLRGPILPQPQKESVKRDAQEAERIKKMMPAYLYIALPCNLEYYDRNIYSNCNRTGYTSYELKQMKPKTHYMSMTLFKVLDYVPMKISGGIITSPKTVPSSLLLETMDGRKIEGYCVRNLYDERSYKSYDYICYTDAVLAEIEKNFVHPRLNLDNFNKYSYYDLWSEAWDRHIYINSGIIDKETTSQYFAAWNEGKESLRQHFNRIFQGVDRQRWRQEEEAIKRAAEKKQHLDDLDRAFGEHSSASAQSHSIHSCPFCTTKCRVPNTGKRINIKCPKCGKEFIAHS